MNWENFAMVVGVLAMGITGILLHLRSKRFNLADLLLVSFGLTYGVGLFVSAFSPLQDVSGWLYKRPDEETLLFSVVILFYLAWTTIYAWDWVFPEYAEHLKITTIQNSVAQVTRMQAALLIGIILFIALYGVIEFGLVGHLGVAHRVGVEAIGERLAPYWYTSLRQLAMPLFFSAIIMVGAHLGKNHDNQAHSKVWGALAVLLLVIAFIYGRRILMYSLILMIFMAMDIRRLFSPKVIITFALALAVLVSASNMYQYYRSRIGETSIVDVASHWDDFTLTNRNLNARRADWAGAYMALEGLEEKPGTMGKIMIQDAANSLPLILTGRKTYVNVSTIINAHFGWPQVDLPNTPGQVLFVDWGPVPGLGVGVLAYLFGILIPAGIFLRLFRQRPFFQSLVVGNAAYILINVENDLYIAIFQFWRYLLIVLLLAIISNLSLSLFNSNRRYISDNRSNQEGVQ